MGSNLPAIFQGCAAASAPTFAFPQSLADKHRPKTIGDFIGLERPKHILTKFAAQPYSSAWLFVGPSGIGKTSMAQALCSDIKGELHHIPSQKCTVEAIEKACHDCHYQPFSPGGFHVVLCDEADKMTPAAQLALLSKLDATAFPPQTIFVFTCNETGNLETRFLSRCRVIEFSSDGMAGEIVTYLDTVWHAEGGNGNCPNLSRLAKETHNNVRDALMRLEIELLGSPRFRLPEKEKQKMQIKYVHPLAKVFPDLPEEEFQKLVKDIREHGLLNPIIVGGDGDLLIDGRQRLRACTEAGVEPRYLHFSRLGLSCSADEYIWSENVTRRHLTDDQRVMLAAQWADTIRDMAKKHSGANLKAGAKKPERADSPTRGKAGQHATRKAIAARAQVSEHKAKLAETVHKNAPALAPKIIDGVMKLKDAAKTARPGFVDIRDSPPDGRKAMASASFDEKEVLAQLDRQIHEAVNGLWPSNRDLAPVIRILRSQADDLQRLEEANKKVNNYLSAVVTKAMTNPE